MKSFSLVLDGNDFVCYSISRVTYYCLGDPDRENGPAIEEFNYLAWYRHGVRHRADGPARVWLDAHERKEWYFDGVYFKNAFDFKKWVTRSTARDEEIERKEHGNQA